MKQIERMSKSTYIGRVQMVLLALAGLFIFSPTQVNATHIVGSDMSFSCLGNDFYEVRLTVRRDCVNGADDAPFDDPASIGIFDAFGNLQPVLGTFGQVFLPFEGADTISSALPDCSFLGGPVCVEEAMYSGIVFLPFKENGYFLAYQRCCRNVTLNNIIDPLETGTTKFVCLTETTLNECNSSPSFRDFPDVIVCANEPINFDHSAKDKDADSLVYSLFTPHSGASRDNPKPQPPMGAPYDTVVYSQGFSLDNLLGGDPLRIDPVTGVITGTPNTVGQFLVGVLVEEWRNGELLSKVRRDFEYNVRACEDIANISFDVEDELVCDGLTINTINTSPDNFGFLWNFNYPSNDPAFMSTEFEPSFTYPEPGFYRISLTSTDPDDGCEVTVTRDVGVFISEIEGTIDCNIGSCVNNSVEVVFSTDAMDPNSPIREIRWDVSTAGSRETLFGQNINLSFACDDVVDVQLRVTTQNGCDIIIDKILDLGNPTGGDNDDPLIDPVGDEDGDGNSTVTICEGESTDLFDSSVDGVTYTFTAMDGLKFTDTINFSDPLACPDVTTKFVVTATDGVRTDTACITVNVLENPMVETSADSLVICEGAIQRVAITTAETNTITFESVGGTLLTDGIFSPDNPGFRVGEEGGVFVFTVSDGQCTTTDSITFLNTILTEVDEVAAAIDTTVTFNSTTNVFTFTINEDELIENFDIVSIRYTLEADGVLVGEGSGSDISIELPDGTMNARVILYFTDSNGCEYTLIFNIPINDDVIGDPDGGLIDPIGDEDADGNATVTICRGDNTPLFDQAIDGVTYTFSPMDGLKFTDTVNFSDPIACPDVTTKYVVTATRGDQTETACITVNVLDNPTFETSDDAIAVCEGGFGGVGISTDPNNTITIQNPDGLDFVNPLDPNNPMIRGGENGGSIVFTVSNGVCEVTGTVAVTIIPTEVDEVEAAIDTVVSFDASDSRLMVSINEDELREMFDIVSIRYTVEAGGQLFEGTGSDIDLRLSPDATTATVTYFFTDSQGCEYTVVYVIDLNRDDQDDDDDEFIDFNDDDDDGQVSVCPGESIALFNSSTPGVTYTFTPMDGLSFTDLTNFSDPVASPTVTTTYTVTATDGVTTQTEMITVNVGTDNIVLSFDEPSLMVCSSQEEANIMVNNPLDGPNTTYEWSFDPSFDVIVGTEPFITILIPPGMSTLFVRAFDPVNCGSNVATIDVIQGMPDFTFDFDPINRCIDGSTSTEVDLIDNDPSQGLNVVFEPNDNITSDINTFPITVMAADGQEQIVLPYTATTAAGCVIMESLTIDVMENLTASINTDSVACDGSFAMLSASSNVDGASFEWSLDMDFTTILSTDQTIEISMTEGTTVFLRAFNEFCQSDIVSTTLSQDDNVASLDTPDRICVGDTVTITATGATDFTITFDDSDNIVMSTDNSVTVTILDGQDNISIPYTAISDQGCVEEGSIELPLGEIIDPTPESMINCGTTSISFMGGEGIADGDILWDFGVSDTDSDQSTEANPTFDFGEPGTYTVSLLNNRTTCQFEDQMIEVVVPEIIELSTDNDTDIVICDTMSMSGPVVLGVANNLGLPVTFTDDQGNVLSMMDTLTLESTAGIMSVTASVTDEFGCSDSIVFNFNNFDPDIDVTFPGMPDGQSACANEDFEVVLVNNDSTSMFEFVWSPDGAIVSGQGTGSVIANLDGSQDLTVEITDPVSGCSTTLTVPVDVVDLDIDVTSSDDDNEIFQGQDVDITVSSSGDIVDILWDNGVTTATQTVSPDETTTYTVTITDSNGCMATGQITITVIPPTCTEEDIFIPTAFSPNNDGNNDVLIVRSNFIQEIDFQILNRYGQEVFRTSDPSEAWNGRFENTGSELSPDVFAYCVRVVCINNDEFITAGTVSLVR